MMLFLDLDGVLAGFDEALELRGVTNRTNFIHKPKEEWTPDEVELDNKVKDIMSDLTFWHSMPMTKDGRQLWDYCKEHLPFILTAKPKNPEWEKKIEDEKRIWVHKNLDEIPHHRFICCYREQKMNYAREGYVLVDDLEQNCKEWADRGGTAVLHTSAEDTIRQLDHIQFKSGYGKSFF